MCDQAAEAGDLQQLQWLYEHGGVLNLRVVAAAAARCTVFYCTHAESS
jgi:hypothetical protein